MPRSAVALARLAAPTTSPTPDAQLLRAYLAAEGQDAFSELVRRHGPMVLAACRRVLGDPHDAEDAFQATFLVLARKAGAVRGTNVAGWLYAVAVRTARGVRVMRDRRKKHERASGGCRPADAAAGADHELAAIIDEELAKLPYHFREAVVLCELRGLSRKQAAVELHIPEGTLSSRLAGAKRRLAEALTRRGLAVPATLGALLAPASVSAGLLESTSAAVRGAAGSVASAAASAVVKGMLFDQLKAVALAAGLLVGAVCGGLAMTGSPDGRGSEPAPAPAPRAVLDPAAKLVAQLGSADFAQREAAHAELRKLGMKAEPALKAALKSEDPEVRTRAAKLLAEIRRDALDELAKTFDPAATKQPDHPIWNRFKAIAGDTRASRELFARVIKNVDWLRRLDAAEAGPEAAAKQYREAVMEVGRNVRANMSVWFVIYVWPGDTPDQVAYLLFLGSYPGAETAEEGEFESQDFVTGEHQLLAARGLGLGLQGKEIAPGPKNHYDETAALAPDSDRVFAKLLAAWLTRRNEQSLVFHGCNLAVKHRAAEMLPVARAIAADKARPAITRATALIAVAQFGTPADLPLFEALFDKSALVRAQEPSVPPGANPPPRIEVQVRDETLALALLLCDQDPFEYGFTNAKGRFRRESGRPVVANYEAIHFGFTDEKARAAAHAKARAFLAERTFDEQVKAAEAQAKKLGLIDVASAGDGIDTKFPIVFEGKGGKVSVKAGSAVLVELPKPTRGMTWQTGGFKPEAIGDTDGPEFTHVLCKWTADGKLTWVMYRKPADKENAKEKLDPAAAKLVEQLGSDEFAVREAAQAELKELGTKAKAAVLAGLKSDNPEVARRCASVVPAIRKAEWREVREVHAKDPAAFDHPVWTKLKSVAGDGGDARTLLADVLADDRAFVAVAEAVENPEAADGLYRQAFARLLNDPSDWPKGRPGESRPGRGAYVAMLLLGLFPGTDAVPDFRPVGPNRPDRSQWNACSSGIWDRKTKAPPPAALQKLFAGWVAARTSPDTVVGGFEMLLQAGGSEGAPAARAIAADQARPVQVRAYALLYLVAFGTADDAPVAAALFADKTELPTRLRDRPVQVRDVATAVALRLHGLDEFKFGFGIVNRKEDFYWKYPELGFRSDDDRARVLKAAQAKVLALNAARAADRTAPTPRPKR